MSGLSFSTCLILTKINGTGNWRRLRRRTFRLHAPAIMQWANYPILKFNASLVCNRFFYFLSNTHVLPKFGILNSFEEENGVILCPRCVKVPYFALFYILLHVWFVIIFFSFFQAQYIY